MDNIGTESAPGVSIENVVQMQPKKKVKRIDFDGDYAGQWAEFKAKLKGRHLSAIMGLETSGNLTPIYALLGELIVDWHVLDDEGNPFPKPTKDDYSVCDELDVDLIILMAKQIGGFIGSLKKDAAGGDTKNLNGASSTT